MQIIMEDLIVTNSLFTVNKLTKTKMLGMDFILNLMFTRSNSGMMQSIEHLVKAVKKEFQWMI